MRKAPFLEALSRKKQLSDDNTSKLARVLTLLDLTGLGVGTTLGLGVYVLAGAVAKTVAGPAVCISFLIAAIASVFAGLCYAEFASRVPRAGSAYIYSYVTVGEFVAFIIGWNLILEYAIGAAGVARGLSGYIDALTNNTVRHAIHEVMPININFLSTYPDFLSFLFVILITLLLAIGVKESTTLNNILTALNLATVAVVLVAGSLKADPKNWKIPKDQIPPAVAKNAGEGGFMPFGISGVMAGAAKCFFGFVGFDCIATTGEEAKNPKRNIPLSIVISLVIIFLAYFGISTVLTMMWPYYAQDPDAPFPHVFEQIGWPVIKWIVTIGAIFALCTSLTGAVFPLPRILYAMANDGLLFAVLARINPRSKTPILATLISGFLTGIISIIFDLQQLIDMMSIGTLLAYTIVAMCVLILRYEDENPYDIHNDKIIHADFKGILWQSFVDVFNLNMNKQTSRFSSKVSKWAVVFFSILTIGFCVYIIYGVEYISLDFPLCLASFIAVCVLMLLVGVILSRQPVSQQALAFKVPLVPLVPLLSIFINFYLMSLLDMQTWIRFAVWLLIGFSIYLFYALRHSKEKMNKLDEHRINAFGMTDVYSKEIAT